ncbi:MAG: DUF2851 family protein [Bacteroidota bacterium]|jgi:hypothetical protein
MNEALLHTIWKYKLTGTTDFIGTKGEQIKVISIGEHNQDSGPDFFNSKIEINHLLLVGNVEVHIKTSDWLKHNHQLNKAYDNLVLHVVFEHDSELPQNIAYNVSVLELRKYVKPALINQYQSIENSKQKIACGKSISLVEPVIWKLWLDRLVISRLEEKTKYIKSIYHSVNHNVEETLYILLCRNFGFKINSDAFELLAKTTPLSLLKKYADNPIQMEALLFGNAGFLDELLEEKYPKQLQNEFEFLKHKHHLIPLKKEIWKFSKTRPANFPTIRISQLVSLNAQRKSLFHFLESRPSLAQLKSFFDVETSAYFQSHFKFGNVGTLSIKKLGESSFNNLLMNTIVPFLFFLSQQNSMLEYQDYAFELLSKIEAETNTKTKEYVNLGIKPENAFESQALIQLYDSYCSPKKCLQCNVGEFLLKTVD